MFETANLFGPVTKGSITTLMGNVILTVPLAVTREGLRPYVTGGFGLLHGGPQGISRNLAEFYTTDRDLLGVNIGGGAIGFVSARTGVRFDVRHFRSLARGGDTFSVDRDSRISFFRASIGVVVRY
jgi:hypothetical protein